MLYAKVVEWTCQNRASMTTSDLINLSKCAQFKKVGRNFSCFSALQPYGCLYTLASWKNSPTYGFISLKTSHLMSHNLPHRKATTCNSKAITRTGLENMRSSFCLMSLRSVIQLTERFAIQIKWIALNWIKQSVYCRHKYQPRRKQYTSIVTKMW